MRDGDAMTAEEMIDGYVAEVVLLLPRRQRPDVARELRDLIAEETADAAETRESREAAVSTVLAGFGPPAEVAARYGSPVALIEPADTRRFLTLAQAGAVLILVGAVLGELIDHAPAQRDLAGAVDGASPVVLGWLGVLVAWFAVTGWLRRRRPVTAWRPRPVPTDRISRPGRLAALAFYVAGTVALVDPAGMLRVVTGGRAAPAAYDALAYDEGFLAVRGPVVLGLLVVLLAGEAALVWQGRMRAWNHPTGLVLGAILCAVLTWVVAEPIFVARPADETAKGFIALIILISLADLAVQARRHHLRRALQF